MKGAGKKAAVTVTALGMVLTAFPPIPAKAAEEFAGQLTSVESVEKGSKDNIVVVKFNGGVTAQLTFLEDGIFRYNVDPSASSRNMRLPNRKLMSEGFSSIQTTLLTIHIQRLIFRIKMEKLRLKVDRFLSNSIKLRRR